MLWWVDEIFPLDTRTAHAIYGNSDILLLKHGNPLFLGLLLDIYKKDGVQPAT